MPSSPRSSTSHNQVYWQQQLALAPFTSHFSQDELIAELAKIPDSQRSDFLQFLFQNGLTTVWLEKLGYKTLSTIWTQSDVHLIRKHAIATTANYLQQKAAIQQFTKALDKESIPHAIFKGAHTRELVYSNPATRPSCDIDVLIQEERREEVIRLFNDHGYTLYAPEKNISHECSLNKANISVDLHWHILRPGRIPRELTDQFLSNRIQYQDHWCCDNTANLFILLIHPVFSKYSLMTRYGLIRMVDLLNWFAVQQVDNKKLQRLLDQTGLRTAAWITLTYLQLFTADNKIKELAEGIAPNPIKKAYLSIWLGNDLAARLLKSPMAVKLGFTLFAHDSLQHAYSFLRDFLFLSPFGSKH